MEGSAWETPTSELIAKANAKKYKMKRVGAKAAKAAERFESKGEILNESEATMFRALAARANTYLLIGLTALTPPRSFAEPLRLLRKPE